jgi:hypothetical protein
MGSIVFDIKDNQNGLIDPKTIEVVNFQLYYYKSLSEYLCTSS